MELVTNIHLIPGDVTRVFGTRTLVVANNTDQEGMYFKDVHVVVQRKGGTSSLSINPEKKEKINMKFGMYFGRDVEPISGIKFEGKTVRDGKTYKFYLCKVGGIVKEHDIYWSLDEEKWSPVGHWEIQILMKTLGTKKWTSVHQAGNIEPYEYPTEKEARRMMDICYSSVDEENKRTLFVAYENN